MENQGTAEQAKGKEDTFQAGYDQAMADCQAQIDSLKFELEMSANTAQQCDLSKDDNVIFVGQESETHDELRERMGKAWLAIKTVDASLEMEGKTMILGKTDQFGFSPEEPPQMRLMQAFMESAENMSKAENS